VTRITSADDEKADKVRRTIRVDDKTYKELVCATAQLMQEAKEQIALTDTVRLSVYLFKACLDAYPELKNQIINQIEFQGEEQEQPQRKDYLSKDLEPSWFGKDFLDFIFGIKI